MRLRALGYAYGHVYVYDAQMKVDSEEEKVEK
jgi:hypothetical protein